MDVAFEAAELTLGGRGASGRCTKGAGVSLRVIIAARGGNAVLLDLYDVGSRHAAAHGSVCGQ